MDQYPEISVNERECQDWTSSRHDSASSVAKTTTTTDNPTRDDTAASTSKKEERSSSYHSFPSPSTHSSDNSAHRTDSSSSTGGDQSKRIEAEYARYTDAPPPYTEKQYEGKTEGEQNNMRMTDYAKEISRMMGRQLVRGLKIDQKNSAAK
jgi:hypothetical protein